MIIVGDNRTELRKLEPDTVDTCITSPPYYGLRDYGVDGQLGLEEHVDDYITKLCDVFDEVARVLKPEGTCWVNIGDSYSATRWTGKGKGQPMNGMNDGHRDINPVKGTGLPDKSLIGVPFRFALEMLNRGWILRNTIIWHKPSCMPSSVKDRFTVDFEYLFFFARNQKYYFEQQLEPAEEGERNKRTVWSINTARYKEAHFATYPEELIETPIKSCCPVGGVVLDPFAGASTTGLVAAKQKKDYIGIELNPEYAEMGRKRIEQYTNQRRLF